MSEPNVLVIHPINRYQFHRSQTVVWWWDACDPASKAAGCSAARSWDAPNQMLICICKSKVHMFDKMLILSSAPVQCLCCCELHSLWIFTSWMRSSSSWRVFHCHAFVVHCVLCDTLHVFFTRVEPSYPRESPYCCIAQVLMFPYQKALDET